MNAMNPVLINIPLPIETDRLILRNVLPGDGASIHDAKAETFAQLHLWMPWAKALGSAEDDEAMARDSHAKFVRREDLMMLGFEKASETPVVFTGLHRMNWDLQIFEIGYWVRSSAQGKGYASETTNALIRYAFNALAARKVTIAHAAENAASARVIEKLGFEKEGVFRNDVHLPTGEVTDHHWYARFNDRNLPELTVRW